MKVSKEDQEAYRRAIDGIGELAKKLPLARDTDQTRAVLNEMRSACVSAYDLCNRIEENTRNQALSALEKS